MAIPELKDAKDRLTDCIYFGDPLSASVGTGFVPTNRQMNTTAPLGGGGDLSTNRTLTISNFAGSAAGAVPTSLGGTTNFLRADGSWAAPAVFTSGANGYAPASGGGTTNYLRADGTWAAPAGTGISGLTTNFYPVATGATSIGNGRISQATDEIRFYTGYTSGTKYESVGLSYDSGTSIFTLRPSVVDFPSTTASCLKLCGQTSSGGMLFDASAITVDDTFFDMPFAGITLSNGLNSDVSIEVGFGVRGMAIRATGPTAAFSVGGFLDISEGRYLWLYNTTSQQMTIVNEDASSISTNRILTMTGANVVLPGVAGSAALFIYSNTDQRWLLVGTNPPTQYPRTLGYVPYQNSGGNLADSGLFYDSANTRYGFQTATPKATVDINGTLATRSYNQALSNGLNSDLPAPTTSYMRVTGPTGAFSVGGVIIVSGENGKRLTIRNTTSQAMTIVNEDASSTAAYRILTGTGANLTLPTRQSTVELVYDSTTARWIVTNATPLVAGGATTQVQFNSAGALTGDTGLVVSRTGSGLTLTLGTDVVMARKSARQFQFGASAASTAAYVATGQSSVGGTDSNAKGGDLSVGGGAGTGTAGGGDTRLITAYPGSFGNTQNSFASRHIYAAKPVALTSGVATTVMSVGFRDAPSMAGGTIHYTIMCTDSVDQQCIRGSQKWAAVDSGGVVTTDDGTADEAKRVSAGTLTATVATVDSGGGDTMLVQITATTSLTPTSFEAWVSMEYDGRGYVTTI